jgi:hypothetical protein
MYLLEPGDELNSKDFTNQQVQELVAVGSALPKDVADALLAAEDARAAAEAAQSEAQQKADVLQSELLQRDKAITAANQEQQQALQPKLLDDTPKRQSVSPSRSSSKSGSGSS